LENIKRNLIGIWCPVSTRSHSGRNQRMGCCECGNECSCSSKTSSFLTGCLTQFLKKQSTLWSYICFVMYSQLLTNLSEPWWLLLFVVIWQWVEISSSFGTYLHFVLWNSYCTHMLCWSLNHSNHYMPCISVLRNLCIAQVFMQKSNTLMSRPVFQLWCMHGTL